MGKKKNQNIAVFWQVLDSLAYAWAAWFRTYQKLQLGMKLLPQREMGNEDWAEKVPWNWVDKASRSQKRLTTPQYLLEIKAGPDK